MALAVYMLLCISVKINTTEALFVLFRNGIVVTRPARLPDALLFG